MIFIAKADGTLEKVFPEAVNQGSVGVNKLILVAPFVAGTAVTAACKLPNGIYTKPTLLRAATVPSLSPTEYGESYNAWEFTLDAAVTQYSGTVTVQFFVNGNGTVLATYADTFAVAKGVPQELPDTPSADVYNDILDALSGVDVRLTAAENTIEAHTASIETNGSAIEYHTTEISQLQAMRIEETELESGDKEYSLVFYDKTEGGVASHGATFTIPFSRISALEGDVETAEEDIEDLKAYDETAKGKFAVLETAKIKKGEDVNGDPVYSFVWTEDGTEERQGEEITIPIKRIKAVEDKVNGLSILTNVSFNSSTEKLYFTFSSGNTIEIDISEFVDLNELSDKINNEIGASVVANAEAAVKPYRDEAQAFASNAERSAGHSQQYASNASASATAAAASAEKASGHETFANQAAGAANTFSAAAENAAQRAESAAHTANNSSHRAEEAASIATGKLSAFEKRLTNLENGISPEPFVTDDTVAYEKTVPGNALPYAALERVGGMSYKSKNLARTQNGTYAIGGGVQVKYVDGSAKLIFTKFASELSPLLTMDYTHTVLKAGTYTIRAEIDKSLSGWTFMINLRNMDEGKNYSSFDFNKGSFWEYTFTLEKQTTIAWGFYLYNPASNGTITDEYTVKVMIAEGSTALPFEPFFEGIRHAAATAIETTGKNLWDEIVEKGGIQSKDGENSNLQPNVLRSTNYIGIPPNESLFLGVGEIGKMFVFFYDAAKKYVGPGGAWKDSGSIIKTPESAYFMRFQLDDTYGTVYKNDVIIAASNEYVAYEPHITYEYKIPEEIRSLYGYGLGVSEEVHNYIDFDRNKYVQMCAERNYQSGDDTNANVVTDGTKTVYALATPIEYDITPMDNYIRVGGGGTLTFVNEHSMAAPSTVTYLMKEASV